jgi:hypothetical protein
VSARGRGLPLFVGWLGAIVLAGIVAVTIAVAGDDEDDQQRTLDRVAGWQGTTFVADGTFTGLSAPTRDLPFSWSASASYRITVPSDAQVIPGAETEVEVAVGRTGKRRPREDEQPGTLQLRVTDDEDHRVVLSGSRLAPVDEEVAAARAAVDRA